MNAWHRSFVLFALCALNSKAWAVPTVSLHWMDCASTAVSRLHSDPGTTVVVASVTGAPAAIRGHQVVIRVGLPSFEGLPDAWRFDPAGCNAAGFFSLTAGSAGCPFLSGPHPTTLSRFEYSEDGGRATFAGIYDSPTLDTTATYVLARFVFDHTAGDSCGCLAQPMCLRLAFASWIDAGQTESVFASGRDYLTWDDPYNSFYCGATPDCGAPGCELVAYPCMGSTPVRAQSWGRLKASYR